MAAVKKHQDRRDHALLSASSSSRWINCPPSPRLEENIPDDKSSIYAAEGTLAHEWAEQTLLLNQKLISKRTYSTRINKLKKNSLWSNEIEQKAGEYVNYVIESLNFKPKGSVLQIEVKIDLTNYIPEGFGSCDSVIIGDGEMEIIDLKYGKGVLVEAEENSQLMLYALGAWDINNLSYDIGSVKLTIHQPRLNHVSSWIIPVKDLINWAEKTVKPVAELAWQGKGLQKAGTWCRWCKVKPTCATMGSFVNNTAKAEFSDIHILKDSQVLDLYKRLPIILDWAKGLNDYMLKTAIDGKKWPGLKIVEGRANRKWSDPDKVLNLLDDELYDRSETTDIKLKGIPEISKLLQDEFDKLLGGFVVKPQGKPALVPDTDKRPEFNNAKNDFK